MDAYGNTCSDELVEKLWSFGRYLLVCSNCLYNTTKSVICQYVIRNLYYEIRNYFSFFVLIYYEKRVRMEAAYYEKGVLFMIKFKVKVMLALREMTQKELAERTGIRPPTISAICLGTIKHLPVDALEKICEVLDCQPADLMEYQKEADVQEKE